MISIIIPIHNSIKYIKQCIESVLSSEYRDIEVLCVDSGNDGTGEYLREIAAVDNRVRYIWDENNSYGYKVNLGIRCALGEYVCVIDSDDFVDAGMYQKLINMMKASDADFVKCDYYNYYQDVDTKESVISHESTVGASDKYNRIVDPLHEPEILLTSNSCLWSGLYKKSFIIDNEIFLHESPGASFQDTGFSILALLYANKVYYMEEALYYYRIDNPDSSAKSNKKIYTIKEEWDWIDHQVRKRSIADPGQLYFLKKRKARNYKWNIDRLNAMEALDFSSTVQEEFAREIGSSYREHALTTLCQNASRIQIYGAGAWGSRVYEYLNATGQAGKVTSFFVSGTPEQNMINNIPVLSSVTGVTPDREALIIVAISGEAGKEVCDRLFSSYYRNVFYVGNPENKYIQAVLRRYSTFDLKGQAQAKVLSGIRNASFVKLCKLFSNVQTGKSLYVGMRGQFSEVKDKCISFSEFARDLNGKDPEGEMSIKYDSVLLCDLPGDISSCRDLIRNAMKMVGTGGKLMILADNRLGLNALCNLSESSEKGFTRYELRKILESCRLEKNRFFSVFPGRILPQILVSEDITPNEDTALRYTQMFNYPEDSVISQPELYDALNKNADIHSFAPLYFIECTLGGEFSDIEQITLTMHRKPEKSTCTLIRKNVVEKVAAYDCSSLTDLKNNLQRLSERGIPTSKIISSDKDRLVIEKLEGVTGDNYLRDILNKDRELFEKEFDRFVQLIFASSKQTEDLKLGTVLEEGYPDLVPLNTIVCDKQFVVIDQEYVQKNLPVNMVIYRSIRSLYSGHPESELVYPSELLYEKYGLLKDMALWKEYSDSFKNELYGSDFGRIFTSVFTPNKYDLLRNKTRLREISSNNTFYNRHSPYGLMPHKQYGIGYCAGVFDMFHVGHVELLRSAKEICDYLIVGVVRDEDCERVKNKKPVIPFDQRLKVVGACRYVDLAVEIPTDARSSLDAYDKYHFDVQFSGSDYENDPYWLGIRDKLRKMGSDLIFFPYTKTVNSTDIRERLDR